MGILARLRIHDSDRRRSLQTPSPSHTKASASVSSSTSDFSHTSYSSASSQDSGHRNADTSPGNKQKGLPGIRHSMPVAASQQPAVEKKRDSFVVPQYNKSSNSTLSQLSLEQGQAANIAPPVVPQKLPALAAGASLRAAPTSTQFAQKQPVLTNRPAPASRHSWQPQLQQPQNHYSPDDTHISMSEESEDSRDEGSEATSDGDSEISPARNHPYYEQWKQYYQALEQQRQQGVSQPSQPSQQRNMYPGMAPAQPSPNTSTERFYTKMHTADSRNSLLLNSRRSTIKSNRSASVPSQDLRKQLGKARAISVNVGSAPKADTSFDETDETDEVDSSFEAPVPQNSHPRQVSTASVASRLRQVSLGGEGDQISDYAAFILSDESEHEATNDDSTLNTREHEKPKSGEAPQIVPENTHDLQSVADYEYYEMPEPADAGNGELNRNTSNASSHSYSSLQSEKHFNVGPSLRRVATPAKRANSAASKKKKKFLPPMAGPPPPIAPVSQPNMGPDFQRQLSSFKRQSTGTIPMSDMYMQQIQQQIQQLQQLQQMQQFHMQASHATYQNGSPGSIPRSTDNFINAKIEEFVQLRTIIASGNKTFEYRLKWLQMLIAATNNRLFAYINIKGEGISPEQVTDNKQYFIRSSVNHLQKLLKELSRSEKKESQKLFAEACYIQGCLHSNAYLERYGQDFNYEQNPVEAERFFHLCLENNPGFFRAYYELGELHESQQDEDQFDLALENYTESAKMGYNRAIYKVALIHLLVPKVRSTRFFSYFKKLADIDMQSNDVQLSGADRDELEEIVGLAQFQLGKIYEGIYPGDLTADDPFVVESLEIAPVNYSKSLSYYNKAAKLSCVQAQVRLGRIYEEGELNRDHNPKKSVQWYMRASSSPLKYRRHPEAMLGLSRWLMRGSNGASKHIPYPDPEKAVQWCERACKEFAYPEAFYQMGLMVEQGYAAGDAHEWFGQAWQAGHAMAGERMGMGENVEEM